MSAFKDLYDTAKATEDTVFAFSPVPLRFVKSGIQNVGVPLVVSAVASQTPFVAPLAGAAIKWGSDAFQSGTHSLAFEAMNSLGQSIASGLPTGAGIQTIFNAISSQTGQTLLAGQDLVTHAVGAVGTSILLGRTITNSAVLTFQKIRPMTVGEVIASSQRTIQRLAEFATSAAKHIRQLGIRAELFVQQELEKMNNPQQQNGQTPKPVVNDQETKVELFGQTPDERVTEAEISERKPQTTQQQAVQSPQVQSSESQQKQTVLASDSAQTTASNNSNSKIKYKEQPTDKLRPQPVDPQQAKPQEKQTGMIEKVVQAATAKPIDQSSESAQDYVLKNIVDKLTAARMNTDRMEIRYNGKKIFQMNGAEIDKSTSITDGQAEQLKQALQDPAAFGGNLLIKQGDQILVHIKEGRIIRNPAGLAQQPATIELETKDQIQQSQSTPQSPSEALWQKYGANQKGDFTGLSKAAKLAAQDGVSHKDIQSMLAQSNQLKQFSATQGNEKADSLARKTTQKAFADIARENRPQQQQSQSQQQSETMAPAL
ncbi:MAG: hypothetical protein HC851_20960 [Acaryochloris sp. RU_4_1]|nr:hypothetical protein [Acaryochloris sp. RU_4_1]NJR56974.1 hypothetical protein [Acaryochloris sp. CRU_2_0]